MTFDSAYWEDRYRHHDTTRHHAPSPHLVRVVADLAAGTVLEAGCGEGADAALLAARGWRVTAADVSPTALGRARMYAEGRGPHIADRIRWVEADLTAWPIEPSEESYDLVTSHYVHPQGPFEVLAARLADLVAPGGTLLLVGHGAADAHSAARAPGHASWRAQEVARVLDPQRWEVLAAEDHTTPGDSGPGRSSAVLHARRTRSVEG